MQLNSGLFLLLFACECGASKSDSSDTAIAQEAEEQDSGNDSGEELEDSGQDTGAEQ